jgi:hypothetical protein
MSGLKCGQRDKGETFPGLTGFEKFVGNVAGDYCYDPKWTQKVAAMKNKPQAEPAPKPRSSPKPARK